MAPTQIWLVLFLAVGGHSPGPIVGLIGMTLLPALNAGLYFFECRIIPAFVFSLCMAPLCAGLTGALQFGLHLDPSVAVLAPALVTMPLAGLAASTSRSRKEGLEPGLLAASGVGVLLGLLTAFLLLRSVNLRLSMHGLLHASITYRIIGGGIPPDNPFFAGQKLVYSWFFHSGAAAMSVQAHLSPLFSFAWINILTAAAVPPCLYLLGRAIGLTTGCAVLGSLIGTFALHPLGPLFFIFREPGVTFGDIEGGLSPGFLVRFLAIGFDLRLASPLTKFWNVSSFSSGIALFLMGLTSLIWAGRGSIRSLLALAVSAAGLLLINPLVGLCFFAAAWAASFAWFRKGVRGRMLRITAALAAAGAASLPYLLGMTGGSQGTAFFGIAFTPLHFLGIALAAGPVLLFAFFGAYSMACQGNREGIALTLFILFLVAMAVCVAFPEENEYKIIRLLVFPAGVLAAAPASRFLKRLRLHGALTALLAAAVLLPNRAIAYAVYLAGNEFKPPLDDRGFQITRTGPGNALGEAYRILREETPADAVVVVNPEDHEKAIGGPFQGDEVPSLGRRVLYTGHDFYLTERCPGFADRLERVEALFGGRGGPLPEPVDGRPLYFLIRGDTVPHPLVSPSYETVYQGRNCALFRLKKKSGP